MTLAYTPIYNTAFSLQIFGCLILCWNYLKYIEEKKLQIAENMKPGCIGKILGSNQNSGGMGLHPFYSYTPSTYIAIPKKTGVKEEYVLV